MPNGLPPFELKRAKPPRGARAYIAGVDQTAWSNCMTGLLEAGYVVLGSVHQTDRERIIQTCEADFVVLLPGWEWERGSNAVVTVAKLLRIPLVDCGTLDPVWTP